MRPGTIAAIARTRLGHGVDRASHGLLTAVRPSGIRESPEPVNEASETGRQVLKHRPRGTQKLGAPKEWGLDRIIYRPFRVWRRGLSTKGG